MAADVHTPAPSRGTPEPPGVAHRTARRRRRVLTVMAVIAVAAVTGFMLIGITGSWAYALELRATKAAAMVLVAYAIGVSTVLFQTVTHNRILTPSIMGFDALYILIQSVSVYLLGALTLVSTDPRLRFALETAAMVGFAVLLHRWLFSRRAQDLYVLVLAGIVFGTLFSSASNLVNRLIDPNEFQTLQDLLFASFNAVDTQLLGTSAVIIAAVSMITWRDRHVLDVIALGHDTAVTLGVDHHRAVTRQLAVIAILVSVATALVGPITFFGLLVANLARQLLGTFRHRWVLAGAVLLGIAALAGGQLVLEQVLGYATALTVIVNLVGGVYFLVLLLREASR